MSNRPSRRPVARWPRWRRKMPTLGTESSSHLKHTESMDRDRPWIESALTPPSEDPNAWVTSSYRCGNRDLLLAQPRDPDRLLDDPTVLEASKSTDYMPYWAYLWPGAILLADEVMGQEWREGVEVLEIGCGLGLAGLAALARGSHVTFSDYSPAALELA